jgi:hypothetical protein
MDRAVPVRKTHASTAGLLAWSETGAAAVTSPPSSRPSLKVITTGLEVVRALLFPRRHAMRLTG